MKPFRFYIEYEIPPLRAIYSTEVFAVTENEALEELKKQFPHWNLIVRKIEKKEP